jgi:hypothetical protein
VFWPGVRQIAEGTDHLLFLLMFLLVAPLLVVARRWQPAPPTASTGALRRTVRVVTAFTVGHSATLIAAAIGGLRVAGPWVEVLIAVSILVTAIHALRPLFPPRGEPFIAGGFGPIHGLAFSTVWSGWASTVACWPGPCWASISASNACRSIWFSAEVSQVP